MMGAGRAIQIRAIDAVLTLSAIPEGRMVTLKEIMDLSNTGKYFVMDLLQAFSELGWVKKDGWIPRSGGVNARGAAILWDRKLNLDLGAKDFVLLALKLGLESASQIAKFLDMDSETVDNLILELFIEQEIDIYKCENSGGLCCAIVPRLTFIYEVKKPVNLVKKLVYVGGKLKGEFQLSEDEKLELSL